MAVLGIESGREFGLAALEVCVALAPADVVFEPAEFQEDLAIEQDVRAEGVADLARRFLVATGRPEATLGHADEPVELFGQEGGLPATQAGVIRPPTARTSRCS